MVREGRLIPLFPSYPLLLSLQAAPATMWSTRTRHSHGSVRDVKILGISGGTACQRKSPERWWNGKAMLCCECQSTFLYSSAISQQDFERNRASFQEGTKVPVDVKTSGCQDSQERFWQVPLALAFVRNREGVWLIALWLKQHKPKHRMRYAMKDSRMITHQVRALHTKCPKDIKGFPSMYTPSWEGRNSSLGSLI